MRKVSIFVLAVFANCAWGQILVNDPAALILNTTNQIQTMAQWTSQIAEMKRQYDQMTRDYALAQQQYEAITGGRGLGNINYDTTLSGTIADPSTMWQGSNQTQQIINSEKLSGNASTMRDQIEARSLQLAAAQKASTLAAAQGAKRRLAQIESLMGQISNTSDQKAISEIQARIQIEQAALANEQNRHQINMQAVKAEEALVSEQKSQYARKILDPSIKAMPSIK